MGQSVAESGTRAGAVRSHVGQVCYLRVSRSPFAYLGDARNNVGNFVGAEI